jgi:O-antigen/teichoic acid export membrane protein
MGAATLLQQASRSIGKIFIGSTLGPAALAYYATGSYLLPVVRVIRSGIEDAVYPELVRAHNQPGGALRLWQRVNVLNCVIFFPASVVLVYYAEPIIKMLFTRAYLPAVPIFSVYALFLIRRCFNTDVLLRTTGRSGFMLWGATGALIVNTVLIVFLAQEMGMIGPAIAFIAAEVVLEVYFVHQALRAHRLTLSRLADWKGICQIALSCFIAVPILLGSSLLPGPEFPLMIAASLLYFSFVFLIAYRLGVSDIGRVVGYAWSLLQRRSAP